MTKTKEKFKKNKKIKKRSHYRKNHLTSLLGPFIEKQDRVLGMREALFA